MVEYKVLEYLSAEYDRNKLEMKLNDLAKERWVLKDIITNDRQKLLIMERNRPSLLQSEINEIE